MGRYVERVENLARLLSVTEAYADGSDGKADWSPLLEVHSDTEAFAKTGLPATGLNIARWYLLDPKNTNSVLFSLERVRDNARGLRHLMSVEIWRQINMFHATLKALTPRKVQLTHLSELCDTIRAACHAHFGLVDTTWYRDEAWLFNRLGVRLERADQSTRLLDIKSYQLGASTDEGGRQPDEAWWNTLLRSASGYHAFRRSGPVNPQADAAAEFILFDSAFPRSVEGCIHEALGLLDRLESGFHVTHGEAVKEARDTLRQLLTHRPPELLGQALHEYLDRIQLGLNMLGVALADRHFDPARPADQLQTQSQGDTSQLQYSAHIVSDHLTLTRATPEPVADILQVRHLTRYRYAKPVRFNQHHGMFRPHTSYDTRLLDLRFSVTPKAKIRWVHDVFGNAATEFTFAREKSDTLEVECVFRVRRGMQAQPDFPIAPEAAQYPFSYGPDQLVDLTPSIVPDYDPGGVVLDWAKRFVDEADFDTWQILERMNSAVKAEFTYDRREEPGVQPPAQTIASRHGSCRDFAMLMMEGVRRLGFAARFVSGYLYDPALDRGFSGEGSVQGAGSTHAWVQVFLPGSGWVEFDPTNGLIGSRNLIRTAVARSPSQAVPLAGSFVGDADAYIGMDVEVEVTSQGDEV